MSMVNAGNESEVTAVLPRLAGHTSWIIEVEEESRSRHVPLAQSRMIVGSSRRADVVIDDRAVSSAHCSLTVGPHGVVIRDLQSTNGTYVSGARVQEAVGEPGTTVTVGKTSFRIGLREEELDEEDLLGVPPLRGVAGCSTAMRRVAASVRRYAGYTAPVLISGETGTGKELIARALHQEGPRAARPFVVLNVAALPRELVESELFGHERGSFTGAVTRRVGAFAEAAGGTLFLDEIGELPMEAQPKLLRALDGYEVRRVGGAGSGQRSNVRVITASHVPLEQRVEEGRFRRDLFHRLEVFVVQVPALRERRSDVGAIARAILREAREELGEHVLTSGAAASLAAHAWPGNVRELRNVLVRAADQAIQRGVIDTADVARAMQARSTRSRLSVTPPLAKAMLARHEGNLSAAARAAGVPRTSFRKLLVGG